MDALCANYTASGKYVVDSLNDRAESQGSSGSGSKGAEEIPASPVRPGSSSRKRKSSSGGRRSMDTTQSEMVEVQRVRNEIFRTHVDKDPARERKSEIADVNQRIRQCVGATPQEKMQGMLSLVDHQELRWSVLAMTESELAQWVTGGRLTMDPPTTTHYSPPGSQVPTQQGFQGYHQQDPQHMAPHTVPHSHRHRTPSTPITTPYYASSPLYNSPPVNRQASYFTDLLDESALPESVVRQQPHYQDQQEGHGPQFYDLSLGYRGYDEQTAQQGRASPQQESSRRRQKNTGPSFDLHFDD